MLFLFLFYPFPCSCFCHRTGSIQGGELHPLFLGRARLPRGGVPSKAGACACGLLAQEVSLENNRSEPRASVLASILRRFCGALDRAWLRILPPPNAVQISPLKGVRLQLMFSRFAGNGTSANHERTPRTHLRLPPPLLPIVTPSQYYQCSCNTSTFDPAALWPSLFTFIYAASQSVSALSLRCKTPPPPPLRWKPR